MTATALNTDLLTQICEAHDGKAPGNQSEMIASFQGRMAGATTQIKEYVTNVMQGLGIEKGATATEAITDAGITR